MPRQGHYSQPSPPRDRLAHVLKWVGAVTSILYLIWIKSPAPLLR